MMGMWVYPEWLSPVAFSVAGWPVRWYGLAYVAGFLMAYAGLRQAVKHSAYPPCSLPQLETWLNGCMLAVLLGGRLGYVFVYQPDWWGKPWLWLAVWRGGMAFHGACLGVMLTTWVWGRREGLRVRRLFDHLVLWVPWGLALGRLANFCNGELWGRPTDQTWGMWFPWVDAQWRHPSQLYECLLEGLVLGALLWAIKRRALPKPGLLSGTFLLGYGVVRFGVEWVREPDSQLGLMAWGLSMGQWLSLPLMALGALLVYHASQTRRKPC